MSLRTGSEFRFPRDDGTPRVECDDFEEFVRNCFRVEPQGYVCAIYERFTGSRSDEVDFIGRQETLVDDLVRFLQMAGEDFNEQALRETSPRNVRGSRTGGLFREFPPGLPGEILLHERRVIRRFGYDIQPSTMSS